MDGQIAHAARAGRDGPALNGSICTAEHLEFGHYLVDHTGEVHLALPNRDSSNTTISRKIRSSAGICTAMIILRARDLLRDQLRRPDRGTGPGEGFHARRKTEQRSRATSHARVAALCRVDAESAPLSRPRQSRLPDQTKQAFGTRHRRIPDQTKQAFGTFRRTCSEV